MEKQYDNVYTKTKDVEEELGGQFGYFDISVDTDPNTGKDRLNEHCWYHTSHELLRDSLDWAEYFLPNSAKTPDEARPIKVNTVGNTIILKISDNDITKETFRDYASV